MATPVWYGSSWKETNNYRKMMIVLIHTCKIRVLYKHSKNIWETYVEISFIHMLLNFFPHYSCKIHIILYEMEKKGATFKKYQRRINHIAKEMEFCYLLVGYFSGFPKRKILESSYFVYLVLVKWLHLHQPLECCHTNLFFW